MTVVYSGTGITFDDLSVQPSAAAPQIIAIGATVASSALTITSAEVSLAFRSATLGSGVVATITGTPADLVVPSTATLGTTSAVLSKLMVLALNNAGTIELAVVNNAGGNNLDETTLISTTAIAGGSNTNNIIYSTTARTSVPFRVLGYVESTQSTAGTWATAPSTIQGRGGRAVADGTGLSSKVIQVARDTSLATGTQAITGAGFTPKAALVLGAKEGASPALWGMVDSAGTDYGFNTQYGDVADTFATADIFGNLRQDAGNRNGVAWTSWDADGMTITWTKTGSPTGTAYLNILFLK